MQLARILQEYESRESVFISFEACRRNFFRIPGLELDMVHCQHHAPHCLKRKLRDDSRRCWEEKKGILERARREQDFFFNCCRYGVRELIAPVWAGQELLGVFFLSADGAPGTPGEERLLRIAGFLVEYVRLLWSVSEHEDNESAAARREFFYQEKCRNFIERRYRENIALGDLAAELQVNANYLSGILCRANQLSFRRMLTSRRLREACEWLKYKPACSITEIAFQCGFQDQNYFSTVFRREYGISPRTYRRMLHSAPGNMNAPSPSGSSAPKDDGARSGNE